MSKTILLLDDDKDFRSMVVPALEAKGHAVLQARTGAEAFAVTDGGGVDLAVVDGLLPDTDGVSWIARLRAAGRSLPVVFVSAFWRDLGSFNRLTKELKVSLVVHKPVAPETFAEEVEALLSGPRGYTRSDVLTAEQAVRSLATDYGKNLPGKFQELAAAVRALKTDRTPARLAEATTLAHRLRGTAGSYGYREVGETAGVIEEALLTRDDAAADAAVLGLGRTIEATTSAPEPAPGAALSSGRLLAVSTSSVFLDQVSTLARQQLYHATCAPNAQEALADAKRVPPDAVFLDLPSEEAAKLARELRSLPGCDEVAIAFVSEKGDAPNRVAAAHAGASLYLTHPLDAEELSAAARQLVATAQVRRPRILVVDDDQAFARHLCAVLERRGFAPRHLADPGHILAALEEAPPDLVLLDLVMPVLSGFDLCRMLRSNPRWQDLPVVMITAQPGVQARIGAFQSGADDYLSKPVVDEELIARVQVRVDRARLMRERYDKDALTGLLLRRPLVEGLRARLLEAVRHGRSLALALIDFDKFKSVNDTFGHLAGDIVLAAFGKLCSRRFRAEDLRGRWGGEEFLLVFPGETTATIQGALERLEAEFAQMEFRGDRGELFRVSFCVGVSGCPGDGENLEDLIRSADRRLYDAKRAGSGRVVGAE